MSKERTITATCPSFLFSLSLSDFILFRAIYGKSASLLIFLFILFFLASTFSAYLFSYPRQKRTNRSLSLLLLIATTLHSLDLLVPFPHTTFTYSFICSILMEQTLFLPWPFMLLWLTEVRSSISIDYQARNRSFHFRLIIFIELLCFFFSSVASIIETVCFCPLAPSLQSFRLSGT